MGYPKIIIDSLENRYKFNLKVMGPIAFHIGFYIFHDGNGVLFFDPNKYIYKIFHIYIAMFGSKPRLNEAIRYPL